MLEISRLTTLIEQPAGFNYGTGQLGNFPLLQNTQNNIVSIPNGK